MAAVSVQYVYMFLGQKYIAVYAEPRILKRWNIDVNLICGASLLNFVLKILLADYLQIDLRLKRAASNLVLRWFIVFESQTFTFFKSVPRLSDRQIQSLGGAVM